MHAAAQQAQGQLSKQYYAGENSATISAESAAESEVEGLFRNVQMDTEGLAQTVTYLRARLSPVLRGEAPDKVQNTASPEPVPSCQVTGYLQEQRKNIQLIARAVQGMLDRLVV